MRWKTILLLSTLFILIMSGCTNQSQTSNNHNSQVDNQTNVNDGKNNEDTSSSSQNQDQSNQPDNNQESNQSQSTNNNGSSNQNDQDKNQAIMGNVTAVRMINEVSGWVGGNGWIARSDDGGEHWKIQYQGEQKVEQIFALNGENAWVIFAKDPKQTTDKRLLYTKDGGEHWAPVGRVHNDGYLHFTSLTDGFVGNLHTNDGGRTWNKFAVPDTIVGNAYFHDENRGWAVTQSNNKFYIKRTDDGGKTWVSVFERDDKYSLSGSLIRSTRKNDAWIELLGGYGMTQQSYSLFHTVDGGETWTTVLVNSTAGGGPAPGFAGYNDNYPAMGSQPGPLYVVNPNIAFMGGFCPACDKSNTIGWTKDAGKTWHKGDEQYFGYGGSSLAAADEKYAWWITSYQDSSTLYTTFDGGEDWQKVYTFGTPEEK